MTSSERFKDLCNLRFGPTIRSNCLGKHAHLPFHGVVQDYQERFNVLVCHTSQLLPSQKTDLFITGLSEHIRADVEL